MKSSKSEIGSVRDRLASSSKMLARSEGAIKSRGALKINKLLKLLQIQAPRRPQPGWGVGDGRGRRADEACGPASKG
jgi:hypothetical protein